MLGWDTVPKTHLGDSEGNLSNDSNVTNQREGSGDSLDQ